MKATTIILLSLSSAMLVAPGAAGDPHVETVKPAPDADAAPKTFAQLRKEAGSLARATRRVADDR